MLLFPLVRLEPMPDGGTTTMRRLLLAVLLVLPPLAQAADQTVRGTQLVIKNPSTPERRKITVKAKESGSDNTVVGNPASAGATVTITANGGSPSEDTYALPAGTSPTTQKPFWNGDSAKGFKYHDPKGANGPVKTAQIKLRNGTFQIKVVVDGRRGTVGVVPPQPGSDGCVLLAIGGGDSYSVAFTTGDLTNQGAVLFKVVKPTAEGSCLPSTTSTTTTSTTSTTPTTTTTLGFPYVPPPGPAPLRYRDLVFATVDVTEDVTYGSAVDQNGDTVPLELDIYEPTGDTATFRPLIIWVHGGSFAFGDKSSPELVDQANVFSRKGYINASINYRLAPPPGCSSGAPTTECVIGIGQARDDARTAVRFFRTNASTYGIDVDRIAMGGSSAGAITALNVGFGSSEDPPSAIAGAVSLSGARLLGPPDINDAPSLLFHGTSDNVVPYAWAVDTVNDAHAVGLDSFLTSWTGAGHVPYTAHRTEIHDQTTNFLWWEMDLANAEQ
jgi:acetyl esterase/lipase